MGYIYIYIGVYTGILYNEDVFFFLYSICNRVDISIDIDCGMYGIYNVYYAMYILH